MKIAWLGHRSAKLGGGIATYSNETVEGLRARGIEVVSFHHGNLFGRDKYGLDVPVEPGSVALNSIPVVKPLVLSSPSARKKLGERLRRGNFDLVHASFWFSSLDFEIPDLVHELGLPIVATFHVAFDRRWSVWAGIMNTAYRLYARALSRCDRVVVFSEAQREQLGGMGVDTSRVSVVPNGVDIERYAPGPSDWTERLQASRLFLYMGRLDAEKNVDELAKAFLAVDPARDVKLAIAGSGTHAARLKRQFRDDRVVFTGHLSRDPDRLGLLRAAEAFFLPSTVEGLSLSMLEAMACGKATVATDVGSDGDALRGAGIVVDPGELGPQLQLAIRELIELPEVTKRLGELARQRAVERFSLQDNLDALVRLYGEVVEARSAA